MTFLLPLLIIFQVILCSNADRSIPWISLIPAHKVSDSANESVNKSISALWYFYNRYFEREANELGDRDRFTTFNSNVREIIKHNEAYQRGEVQYETGLNEFTDKNKEDLDFLFGLKFPENYERTGSKFLSSVSSKSLPESVDWRSSGAVTEVKNQGQCGSCWAFSSTGSIEGQYFMKYKKLPDLSEQQLVDCSKENHGCQGGVMDLAFWYIRKAGGIESEKKYPYISGKTGRPGICSFEKENVVTSVTGFVDIPAGEEQALMEAVAIHGPISVAINAGLPNFMRYRSGVYSDPECNAKLNHAVLLVGYGEEHGTPYWLIKNSWGESWGDDGYVKIARNANNMCGVSSLASYPLV